MEKEADGEGEQRTREESKCSTVFSQDERSYTTRLPDVVLQPALSKPYDFCIQRGCCDDYPELHDSTDGR